MSISFHYIADHHKSGSLKQQCWFSSYFYELAIWPGLSWVILLDAGGLAHVSAVRHQGLDCCLLNLLAVPWALPPTPRPASVGSLGSFARAQGEVVKWKGLGPGLARHRFYYILSAKASHRTGPESPGGKVGSTSWWQELWSYLTGATGTRRGAGLWSFLQSATLPKNTFSLPSGLFLYIRSKWCFSSLPACSVLLWR